MSSDVNAMYPTNYPGSPPMIDSQYAPMQTGFPSSAYGSNGGGANPNTPTLGGLIQSLRRRWFMALTLATLAAGLTFGGVFLIMPPKFVASVRFHVEPQPHVGAIGPNLNPQVEFPLVKGDLERQIRTPMMLSNALLEKVSHGRTAGELGMVRDMGAGAVDFLENGIKTDFFLAATTMRATLAGDNADDTAELLNAVATVFLREYEAKESGMIKARINGYSDEAAKIEGELNKLRTELGGLLKGNAGVSRDDFVGQQHMLRQDVSNAKFRLSETMTKVVEAESEIDRIRIKLSRLDSIQPSKEEVDRALLLDPDVQGYLKRIGDLEKQISDTLQVVNPAFQQEATFNLRNEVGLIRARIQARRTAIMPTLLTEVRQKTRTELEEKLSVAQSSQAVYKSHEKKWSDELVALETKLGGLQFKVTQESTTSSSLKNKIETTEKSLNEVLSVQTRLKVEKYIPRVTLQQSASAPSQRDTSRQMKLGGAGSVAMFGLVLFAVALFEFMSRKVTDPLEISRGLGMTILGTLPAAPKRRPNLNRPATETEIVWQNQLNESVDGVRTILMHANRKDNLRVVMVTSPNSGEGKTTLASQLAASLSRAWKKVLLIDGDLRNPGCHKLFDTVNEPGFSEVLRGELPVNDAVKGTSISRLWVLPAGNWDNHAVQALSQESVRNLFEQLKQSYDFIIVDSSPVLPVNDALLMAQNVDAVMFSILKDVSRTPEIQAAQLRLAPLGIRMLGGVVLGMKAEVAGPSMHYVASKG